MNGIKYRFTALLCALIMLFSGSAELLGFAVASRARSVELVASDGKSYRITVTCESGSGIPDDAELYVKEITDVTDGADDIPFAVYSAGSALTYEDYLDRSANLLGGSVNDFAFIKVFDIKLLDPVSGDEYQPLGTVNVSIELLDSDINENTSVNVIHFGAEEELVESAFEGETVEFAAGGFSVYTVAGVDGLPRLTYRFYVPNDGGTYSDYALYTDNGSTFTQRVKRGERPVVPQLTSDSANKSFAGWYEGDNSTGSLTFSASPYDFSEADNITASRAVDLYALFADYAYAVFYDQYDTAAETFPIACLRRVPLSSDPGAPNEVRLDDITVTYNGGESANMALYGWSLTPVTVPGAAKDDYGDDVSVILDATYPVAATVSFYPVFKQIFWLSFYSGTEHSGANYVPPAYYFTAEGPGALPVPTRAGYTFGGWYTGTLSTESDGSGGTVEVVNYGKRMTDENGTPLANQSDGGLYVYGGRLLQTSDATLYAYWNENTAADYRIIIYTQKPDDAEGLADGDKHYDYAESVKLTGDIGQSVTVDNEYKTRSYEGFAYSRCDSAKTVSADGGTVLKVYYDKTAGFAVSGELRSLVFLDSVSSAPSPDLAGTPVALACGESIDSRLPANPVSGRIGYEFRGWFMDTDCTVPAEFGKMPDRDVTYYAGWVSVKYRVEIDPNYGALNGTGALWFNNRVDEDPIREYIQVTREYVESSSGTYYYVKHDFRYYNGNPPSGADRNAYYTTAPGEATEFSTFEYAPNYYRYAGWYEVHDDGSETKYDFSQHTDHNTRLKLHWKRIGTYYIVYNPSATVGGVEVAGVIDGGDGNETLLAALDSAGYADNAEIVVYRSARTETAQPYNFIGWKIRGDESGAVYGAGQAFELNSEFATTIGGKETIYLDAVFARVGTAKIIYDANGGSVDPAAADCGRYYSESGAAFSTAANAVSATAYNIANNADFVLSDGSGFSHGGADITLAGWSDTAEYIPGVSKFFAPGERIVVDSEEPYTLYAIWQTTVTYHLNNAGASWADGEWDGYTDDASGNKCLTVYLGSPVPEPEHVPAYAGTDCMFYSWRTAAYAPGAAPGDENLYDFAQPVTGALDLYAYWDGPVDVPLHAVDSSLAALAGRDAEWLAAEYVPVGTAGVDIGSAAGVAAYMKNGSAAGEIPEGYEFAFVAAHDKNAGIQSISADEAVKRVYYNASRQRLFVEYALDGKADALLSEDTELYIVCFGLEELDIGYRTMGFDGALSDAAVNASAPAKVPAAAQSDITSLVSAPMTYPSAAAQCYSYAIGPAGADNASELQFITDSGDSDSSRPTLVIQHTWKGYRYSVDGANWTDCGYDVQIFVLYFEQQPRIITVEESTLGTSAVSQTGFAFTAVITEYKNGVEQGSPRVISFTLRDGEAKALAVYRRTDGEGNEYVQKAVVTQTADAAFYTDNSSAYGTKNSGAEWEYTAAETPENPRVEFVNTHRSLTVEVHVAMVEDGGVFLRDNYRNYVIEKYSFPLELGAEADLLTALPYNNLFTGDLAKYALGGVVCGTGGDAEGSAVDIGSMDVAKVAYGRVSGNIHELLLKDSGGSDICELGEYKLYYLFYPMPEIRYVEENEDGTLTEIKGSYDGVSVIDDVTYNRAPLTMNGGTVTQAQGITIPVSGFVISQTGGSGCFRMPPLLDDGVFERYLIYTRIAAGSAGAGSIADLGAANVSDGKTLRLQVRNNQLEYSFDGANWRHLPLSGIPTIYAIYTERGYDLQITKTVDVSASGSDPIFTSTRFTVTVESSAITASKYGCTGLGATEISATPASGTQPGIIRFTVGDGSSVRIIGLKRGDYTVTESGNENYDLTAKTGTIISSARVPAAVEDNTKVEFSLDNEMAIDFFNSPKKICKIKDGGTEHVFYKLRDAIAYIGERVPDNTATVEMLSDYRMPAADSVSIPDDYNVTFTTAGDGVYYYQGSGTATVCRTPSLDSSPMFSNGGVLSFTNVNVDGGSVAASAPVITSTGSVTVGINAVIRNSVNSGNGGAIYASSGNVTVIGTVSGNTASKGGAVYYSGSGSVSVTGRITGNTSAGDGGGIYAESGNVDVSGSAYFSGNTADTGNGGRGGAVFVSQAIVTLGGSAYITGCKAAQGNALFVDKGSASFSENVQITGNASCEGGAVRAGSLSARLNFTGDVVVHNNTIGNAGTPEANVYLGFDSDTIINATELGADAYIGVYVPGEYTSTLYKNRGDVGSRFATYSGEAGNITAFVNDRQSAMHTISDSGTKKLLWGKSIKVRVVYLDSFFGTYGFPPVESGSSFYSSKTLLLDNEYYPSTGNISLSELANTLYPRFSNSSLIRNTAALYGFSFLDDATQFDEYITDLAWNSGESKWQVKDRSGNSVDLGDKQIIIYYALPAFISIENNTKYPLTISSLTIYKDNSDTTGHSVINVPASGTDPGVPGYGLVFAKNGSIKSGLPPVSAGDLQLGAGASVRILVPGGVNRKYTLSGVFTAAEGEAIPLRRTNYSNPTVTVDGKVTPNYDSSTISAYNMKNGFTLSGKTLNVKGGNYEIIFGTNKMICRVVADPDPVPFPTIHEAIEYIVENGMTTATVEMLTDYLIPKTDPISIPEGYDITLTTAEGEAYQGSSEDGRAIISRDSENKNSFITGSYDLGAFTKLTVANLIMDGKSIRGNSDGGAVKTKNIVVDARNTEFKNFISPNGGGVYVEFTATESYDFAARSKLTISENSSFVNCQSDSTTNRQGGGAIWTNAYSFTLSDTTLQNCRAGDQGGAVFHRIDLDFDSGGGVMVEYNADYRRGSSAVISGCTFSDCTAKAAGGLEIDAYSTTVSDSSFANCVATSRNGGGLNIFIHTGVNANESRVIDEINSFTATNCTFTNCLSNTGKNYNGGALRTTTYTTVVTDCTFAESTSGNGGGIAITNKNTGASAIVTGCTVSNCTAAYNGGGIYCTPPAVFDNVTATENNASGMGGGIYAASNVTLRNGCLITRNRLSSGTADNAAGMYIPNGKTVYIGAEGDMGEDSTTVKDNYTISGTRSNLRLPMSGSVNANCVQLLCKNLSGEIYVINAKNQGTQFGVANIANPQVGFTNEQRAFKADDDSVWGIVDRLDTQGKKLVWGGPPLCKITDSEGRLLYFREGGTDFEAIFDRLDNGGTSADRAGAFSYLKYTRANMHLYYADGEPFDKGESQLTVCVKMLVENYTPTGYITTNQNNKAWLNIIFCTEDKTSGVDYPYRGRAGTKCTIHRSTAFKKSESLVTAKVNTFTLQDIILDGGSQNGVQADVRGCLLFMKDNDNATLVLGRGAVLQNGATKSNGGGICCNTGYVIIDGGIIRNCQAQHGGGVYLTSGKTLTINGGNIEYCQSTRNGGGSGGGIFINTGTLNINGGRVEHCVASKNGGGVYLADSRTMNMSGGFIVGNSASIKGGGVAVGGKNCVLKFSEKPTVSGNKLTDSVNGDVTCNVELDYDTLSVIQTSGSGLTNGAYIGVYIPEGANLFDKHGNEGDPFGTYAAGSNTTTLYGFVNDVNGLKGGHSAGPDPSGKTIYWIKIFSLEIENTVEISDNEPEQVKDALDSEVFHYIVTLSGASEDGSVRACDIDGEYGAMTFVCNTIFNTSTAEFDLKHGESIKAENLPKGLRYDISEELTADQRKRYCVLPSSEQGGYIGENATEGVPKEKWYISNIGFTNLLPVCKLTDNSGNILYRVYNETRVPAVYMDISDALAALGGDLYTGDTASAVAYSSTNEIRVEMLAPVYNVPYAVTAASGMKITFATAKKNASRFPYRDPDSSAMLLRGFADESFFTVENGGKLTLADITVDGVKGTYTVAGNGGIVNVESGGLLYIRGGAVLQNSHSAQKGGAVYAASGARVYMTDGSGSAAGGTVWRNFSDGDGAGIYLAEGSRLFLAGNPSFGGAGTDKWGNITQNANANLKTGSISATNGGKAYSPARQDIFIAESGSDPSFSLAVNGDIYSFAGTIWVWAESAERYGMMRPFAEITGVASVSGATYAAFRNAQADSLTFCGSDTYLSGQSGEVASLIYWTGGYDLQFVKTDGFGNPLAGAVFTLYTDSGCTVPMQHNAADVTAVSANGTGALLFEKIPAGIYYMKETSAPAGCANGEVYIVLVGDSALNSGGAVLADITGAQIAAQTGSGIGAVEYAAFRYDTASGKASATPDIKTYGLVNSSAYRRRVIFKKINTAYLPLEGVRFDILRCDMIPVAENCDSGVTGVFWIGELPYGVYYLHEQTVPDGYKKLSTGDNWFRITVNESGVSKPVRLNAAP